LNHSTLIIKFHERYCTLNTSEDIILSILFDAGHERLSVYELKQVFNARYKYLSYKNIHQYVIKLEAKGYIKSYMEPSNEDHIHVRRMLSLTGDGSRRIQSIIDSICD
jgi:DNA-binding PadR family transcriptional regulator